MRRSFSTACLFVLCSISGSTPLAHARVEGPAVVTFTIDFPKSQPEHYSIRVPSTGSARYQSTGRLSADSDETDTFDLDFTLDAETLRKIFDLTAKAKYFQQDVASRQKGLAFTGSKTLGYKDEQRTGESTYNYSAVPAVQELTSLLQSVSTTLEFGHRLRYDHRYQKLALDEELKRMEEMVRNNQLIEVTAIESILNEIIADPSVINVTRARAQRLLSRTGVH